MVEALYSIMENTWPRQYGFVKLEARLPYTIGYGHQDLRTGNIAIAL